MDGSLYVTSPILRLNMGDGPQPTAAVSEVQLLLKQVLEVQKEQLAILKAQQVAADNQSRWRAFLNRWSDEFPSVGQSCRQSLPLVERAYLQLVNELTEKLLGDTDEIDNEFALSEFLDRYGIKLNQLGALMSQIGPISDAAQ